MGLGIFYLFFVDLFWRILKTLKTATLLNIRDGQCATLSCCWSQMKASIGLKFYQTHNRTCRIDMQALKVRQRLTSLVKIAAVHINSDFILIVSEIGQFHNLKTAHTSRNCCRCWLQCCRYLKIWSNWALVFFIYFIDLFLRIL